MNRKESFVPFDIEAACTEAIDAIREYAKEDGLVRSDYQTAINGLKRRDFSRFADHDWFLLFDALGTRGKLCFSASELYTFASYAWHMAQHFNGLTASARRSGARHASAGN